MTMPKDAFRPRLLWFFLFTASKAAFVSDHDRRQRTVPHSPRCALAQCIRPVAARGQDSGARSGHVRSGGAWGGGVLRSAGSGRYRRKSRGGRKPRGATNPMTDGVGGCFLSSTLCFGLRFLSRSRTFVGSGCSWGSCLEPEANLRDQHLLLV